MAKKYKATVINGRLEIQGLSSEEIDSLIGKVMSVQSELIKQSQIQGALCSERLSKITSINQEYVEPVVAYVYHCLSKGNLNDRINKALNIIAYSRIFPLMQKNGETLKNIDSIRRGDSYGLPATPRNNKHIPQA